MLTSREREELELLRSIASRVVELGACFDLDKLTSECVRDGGAMDRYIQRDLSRQLMGAIAEPPLTDGRKLMEAGKMRVEQRMRHYANLLVLSTDAREDVMRWFQSFKEKA